MIAAGGFQIAFLVFSLFFLSMLLGQAAAGTAALAGFPADFVALVITFALGAALFVGVAPLRQFAASELGRPLPLRMAGEVAVVALLKLAVPAAIVGAAAIAALTAGDASAVRAGAWPIDPAAAWSWARSPAGIFRMVVLSWFAGPIIEELVFRGLLYRAWERRWGWIPALLLTSACFSLCHPTHMASSFVGSIAYVCILRRSGTLLAPIGVHVLFNILISWPLLGQVILQAPPGDPARWSTWAPFLACLAFTAVALPAYLLMSRRDARDACAR